MVMYIYIGIQTYISFYTIKITYIFLISLILHILLAFILLNILLKHDFNSCNEFKSKVFYNFFFVIFLLLDIYVLNS